MKFKNIKKKIYKKKSPSNSRTIPEKFKFFWPKFNSVRFIKLYGGVLKVFVILIFIIAVVVVGYDLQQNWTVKQEVDLKRMALMRDLRFWENFIAKNQNFPDAYFQISILEYKLGDASRAKKYLQKGLSLDPNSKNGREIEKLLK